MSELTDTTVTKINHTVGEAVMSVPGEETIVLATVVSGYAELISLNPANRGYLERLLAALFKFAEFMMERGRHNIARQLVMLGDDIKKGSH